MQASFDHSRNHVSASSPPPMSTFANPPEPEDWIRIRPVIRSLYVHKDLPLTEVSRRLRNDHGFKASHRMIKGRLKEWGYHKNAKKKDWQFLSRLDHTTKQQGRTTSTYLIRGHRKTIKDLHRFIRNQGISSEQFLAEAIRETGDQPIPDYICAVSPDMEDSDASQNNHARRSRSAKRDPDGTPVLRPIQRDLTVIADSQFSTGRSNSCDTTFDASATSSIVTRGKTRDSVEDSPTLVSPSSFTSHSSVSCSEMQEGLETCVSQMLQAQPLELRTGKDDLQSWNLFNASSDQELGYSHLGFICGKCNRSSLNRCHTINLDKFYPRSILNDSSEEHFHLPASTKEQGSWLWVARCLLACILFTRGVDSVAELSLREADREFERLLKNNDPLLLTAANLTITILHQHDQGLIAQRIMQSPAIITQRLFADNPNHPIRITFEYLAASADADKEGLRRSGITSKRLQAAFDELKRTLPSTHQYVIAAEYNLSWILKSEGMYEEAEYHARQVYGRSCEVLTEEHLQSITSLAVIAGCLAQSGQRPEECASLYSKVIHGAQQQLGRSHPYTVEAKRRLANLFCEILDRKTDALQLYKDVVWGRMKMLGKQHKYTQGALNVYRLMLKTMNLWETKNGEPSKEQSELNGLLAATTSELWKLSDAVSSMMGGDSGVEISKRPQKEGTFIAVKTRDDHYSSVKDENHDEMMNHAIQKSAESMRGGECAGY